MSKDKILSANDVKRVVGVTQKQIKKVMWHTANIYVKPFLVMEEYISTVDRILEMCCSPDDEGYIVALLDFAIRLNIVDSYSYVELPEDPKELFYVLYASDLYETVYKNACQSQIDSIKDAVWLCVGGGH